MSVDTLLQSLDIVFSWPLFGWLIVGILVGIVLGALPGIGPAAGMAIALPITIALDGITALVLLIGIYNGGMYGGSIAAILLNTPGTSGAAATVLDGYPMARSGKVREALSISAVSSFIGGLGTGILLLVISPLLMEVVLAFQSPERFLIAVLGLSLITIIARSSITKGIIAGSLGLLISTIGIAPMYSTPRYTFGMFGLYNGVHFVAVLMGLFAISEMFVLAAEKGAISKTTESRGSVVSGIRSTLKRPITLLKSTLIGLGIGSLPGAGATISNFVAYSEAMRSSDSSDSSDSTNFGEGHPKGVVSAESANNSTVGGSLIPTIAFGIPGSGSTAVLLGGLILHGLRPGPDMFSSQLHITYSVFISYLVGSFIILVAGLFIIPRVGHYITKLNVDYIIPIVVVLAVFGSLALRNNWMDVFTLASFGILGFFMKQYNYSLIAFVLGVVLGPIAESNLHRSLQISNGSWMVFVNRPISLILVLATVFVLFGPMLFPPIRDRISEQLG